MDTLLSTLIKDPFIRQALYFVVLAVGSSAYYSLHKSSRKILALFVAPIDALTEAEQIRVDRLLESGKRFHNFSFVLAGILIALSSLTNFDRFSAPFGEIIFPKLQSSLGLYLLCIVSLIISDRYFLMAYPWMRIDNRRPPYDWIAMGLNFERSLFSSFIFQLPMHIAVIATAIILGTDTNINKIVTASALLFTGFGLVYLPRTFYYWAHLIGVREDHRGGSVTLSIYLLYWYRTIRQILYLIYLSLPIVLVIPQWQNPQFLILIIYSTAAFGVIYAIRMLCSAKFVYRKIDELGLKFGFPTTSHHYH